MKVLMLVILSFVILCLGYKENTKAKNTVLALDEIVRFITLFKQEISFRELDFYSFYDIAEKSAYKFLDFKNNEISIKDKNLDLSYSEFEAFLNEMGKTDAENQKEISEVYINKFNEELALKKSKIKNKIQVNSSLTILSLVCVFVLFV